MNILIFSILPPSIMEKIITESDSYISLILASDSSIDYDKINKLEQELKNCIISYLKSGVMASSKYIDLALKYLSKDDILELCDIGYNYSKLSIQSRFYTNSKIL